MLESEYNEFFVNVDCPTCEIKVLTPGDKKKIKQGNPIKLSWEKHPMAQKYNIAVNNQDTGEYPLEFVKVDTTSYQIPEQLPEGNYYFSVFALDSTETNKCCIWILLFQYSKIEVQTNRYLDKK